MRDLLANGNHDNGDQSHDPESAARASARRQLPKRFYASVGVDPTADGFGVVLDGRPVRTPTRQLVELPREATARLVANEFEAQTAHIDPATMPVTRLVNTAIDGISNDMQAVAEDVMRFAASDLVCYRADGPESLVNLQNEHWDPVVDFARSALNARFILAEGIVHVEQPREAVGAIGIHLQRFPGPFRLAAIHTMTSVTGSALLAMAVAMRAIDAEAAWTAAHVDEDWNISQWGDDADALQRRAFRKADMMAAVALLETLHEQPD